ncbi:MAG: hypothetical protein OXQ94_09375 [Gemmatimonadota bacterium]|nr:hypothetical protein [Gemmatimonadota bacterium]MDE2871880.1 hypothetical protein [Gemmatimonadota bacterium]
MRRRTGLGLAGISAILVLTACGPARVTVVVELEGEDGGATTFVDDVEVRLLPYDRDFIFDSLTAAAATPEPEMPAELLAAQAEIAQAEQEWRDAEDLWNTARDTMKKLNEELEGLNRAMNLYKQIYAEFERWEREERRSKDRSAALFERWTDLDKAARAQLDSVKMVRRIWADQAFEDVGLAIEAKIEETGLEEAADTTGAEAEGVALLKVPPGDYWVYARHELPNEELYWNLKVTVMRGDPVVVRLNRENAEVREIN